MNNGITRIEKAFLFIKHLHKIDIIIRRENVFDLAPRKYFD